jgi:diazepam-binding inhibitor (GABA receptor modulator, acyl-CoA-binding protein)
MPQGKAKQKAWQKEVDAGTSASSAEQKYIELVEKLKQKYGFDPNKKPEAVGSN